MSEEFKELNEKFEKFDNFGIADTEEDKKWLNDKFANLNLKVDKLKTPAINEKKNEEIFSKQTSVK